MPLIVRGKLGNFFASIFIVSPFVLSSLRVASFVNGSGLGFVKPGLKEVHAWQIQLEQRCAREQGFCCRLGRGVFRVLGL